MTDQKFESLLAMLWPNFEPRFYSKIVSVTHPNSDGSDRARILSAYNRFALLDLEPEPTNPVDPKAIAVRLSTTKEQVGYLHARTAHELLHELADSESWWVGVIREFNRLPDGRIVGADILIGEMTPKSKSRGKAVLVALAILACICAVLFLVLKFSR